MKSAKESDVGFLEGYLFEVASWKIDKHRPTSATVTLPNLLLAIGAENSARVAPPASSLQK